MCVFCCIVCVCFFNNTATPEIYTYSHTLPLHDALPISWHAKKLPRGALAGNRFRLVLRGVQGGRAAIDARLQAIAEVGVPNYFGEQRFGREGANLGHAVAMFAGKRFARAQRTHLLSAARSELINRGRSEEHTSELQSLMRISDAVFCLNKK